MTDPSREVFLSYFLGKGSYKIRDRFKWEKYRCLDDVDDEVRDRAAFYLKALQNEGLINVFVRNGEPLHLFVACFLIQIDTVFSLSPLEINLLMYIKDPRGIMKPYDITQLQKVSLDQATKITREDILPSLWKCSICQDRTNCTQYISPSCPWDQPIPHKRLSIFTHAAVVACPGIWALRSHYKK